MKKSIFLPKYLILFLITSLLIGYWIIKILNIQDGEILYTPDASFLRYETYFGTMIEKDYDTFQDVEDVLYIGSNKNSVKFYFSDLAVIKDYEKLLIISLICFILLFVFYKYKFNLKD